MKVPNIILWQLCWFMCSHCSFRYHESEEMSLFIMRCGPQYRFYPELILVHFMLSNGTGIQFIPYEDCVNCYSHFRNPQWFRIPSKHVDTYIHTPEITLSLKKLYRSHRRAWGCLGSIVCVFSEYSELLWISKIATMVFIYMEINSNQLTIQKWMVLFMILPCAHCARTSCLICITIFWYP